MVAPGTTNVILSGVFGGAASPIEEWSFRLFLDGFITSDQAKRQAMADAVRAAWVTHLAPLHRADITLVRTRVVSLTDNGAGKHAYLKRADGSYVLADNVVAASGSGSGTVIYPPQVAVTVSLGTAAAGPRGKGRVFLPATVHTLISGEWRLAEASSTAICTGFRGFLQAVNTAGQAQTDPTNATARVSVYSAADNVLRPVTQVRVGRALDTIRTRRGDLAEGYVQQAVV